MNEVKNYLRKHTTKMALNRNNLTYKILYLVYFYMLNAVQATFFLKITNVNKTASYCVYVNLF